MTYEEAIDEISQCVPLEHIAQEAGVTETTIERTQLDPSHKFYLPPQRNWRQVIARLAWERSGILIALARDLEEVRETAFMTFQEAMSQVVHCIAPECLAHEAGVSVSEIRQAQLDPSDEFYVSPPPHWRQVIARLAWERSDVLQSLARGLEREADSAVL